MSPTRAARLLAAMLLPLALLACGDADAPARPPPAEVVATNAVPTSTLAATPAATPAADRPRAGIAGIIPPNFPQPSEADWRAFFDALPQLGGLAGNYTGWRQEDGLAELARNGDVLSSAPGIEVVYGTGFHRDTHPGIEVTVDFRDPEDTQRFTDDLATFARERRPALLGIANEVNRVWEAAPDAFDAWATALPSMVQAVHDASPETQVYVTFQYEFLRGGGAVTGVQRPPQWGLLDRVAPHVDIVAFTTYPFFDYETPEEIPPDYYAEAATRAGGVVGFTEVGWPSAAIAPLEGSALAGLGGTLEEQAAFIDRLPALLQGVDPAFVLWVWAYDTPVVGPTFGSLGLADQDGAAKPAWDRWAAFSAR